MDLYWEEIPSFRIYHAYTLHTHSIHTAYTTAYTQRTHRLCIAYTQCTQRVHKVDIQCTHRVCIAYTRRTQRVHTVYIQRTHRVHIAYTQHTHTFVNHLWKINAKLKNKYAEGQNSHFPCEYLNIMLFWSKSCYITVH